MRAAIFIERDGILNFEQVVRNQPVAPMRLEQLEHNPAAVEPLRQLKAMGYLLIATTNQPAVSQGLLPRNELDRMHAVLRRVFDLDDILVCPHESSDHCPCRKPRPGLFTEAAFSWHLNLQQSFVISNKWQDAEAAMNVGCTSLLISSPWMGKGHHDMVLPTIEAAVKKIAQLQPANQVMVA